MHGIFHDVIAVVIRLAERQPTFDPGARQENSKATRMMVAPVIIFGQ